jgi:hypothetical protein
LAIFFETISSNSLLPSFIVVFFYYLLIGVIYLVSQLISKIYNSQNPQKISQKAPTDYSQKNQNTIPQNQNMNNSSSEISNHPQQKNIEKGLAIDKIKFNLVSKWHFWAILVFSFLVNSAISFVPLMILLFRTILFSGSPTTVLIIYLSLLIFGSFLALVFFGVRNRINSILLSIILTISLFWSVGNIIFVTTNFNFANFSTCKDFRILKQSSSLYYLDNNQMKFLDDLGQSDDKFEIKIEDYKTEEWQNEKIGEISKLDKIKSCLIPVFENKKVILIEELSIERDPNFPQLPNTNSIPLPTDSNFSITELPNNFLILPKPPSQ